MAINLWYGPRLESFWSLTPVPTVRPLHATGGDLSTGLVAMSDLCMRLAAMSDLCTGLAAMSDLCTGLATMSDLSMGVAVISFSKMLAGITFSFIGLVITFSTCLPSWGPGQEVREFLKIKFEEIQDDWQANQAELFTRDQEI